VQLILEKLQGGGHFDVAGAQVKNATLQSAYELLKSAINEYFDYDYKNEHN
jgi:c-di-AMP phosphodiesterase-like protein